MKEIKDFIINLFNGFCMALADSVPGVSGGTVAFILGFYDRFISSIDDLFRGTWEKKKDAFIYLVKIGIGWIIGFLLAASILSSLFSIRIYEMSSLFLGFIIFAIPLIIKEELDVMKGKYINIIFAIIGIAVVVGIALLNQNASFNIDMQNFGIGTLIYLFIVAMIAISAMVLPGISGSTILLIFGIYIPIMNNIKAFIHMDFSVIPTLIAFGLGMILGIMLFARVARKCLEKHRSQTIYTIIGLMIGSIYSIILGPTTIDEPQEMMNFDTFNVLFFALGGIIILGLEFIKKILKRNESK